MPKIDIEEMYAGIRNAETGSEKNPYIRTKSRPKGAISTAFGPVQVTSSLARGAHKVGYLSEGSKKFYETEMKPRYDKMKKVAGKRYDYGGDAEFDGAKHGSSYEQFAKDIMTGVSREAKDNDQELIKKWRGRSKEQDPKYYAKVEEGRKKYREQNGEGMRKMFASMKGTDKLPDQGRPNTLAESELD